MLYLEIADFSKGGPMPADVMWESDKYFDLCDYEPIMMDPFTVWLVKTIDKSDVVAPNLIQSPFLGAMSPRDLSSGCKTVLCMRHFPEYRYCLQKMGENVLPFVVEAARGKDIRVYSNDLPLFNYYDDYCVVENTGEKVHFGKDLRDVCRRLKREGKI